MFLHSVNTLSMHHSLLLCDVFHIRNYRFKIKQRYILCKIKWGEGIDIGIKIGKMKVQWKNEGSGEKIKSLCSLGKEKHLKGGEGEE